VGLRCPREEVNSLGKLDCPICGAALEIPEDALIGEIFSCDECGTSLEIKEDSGKKLLAEAAHGSEDWGE
jgi:alpha-aminoadipate carrier protein LysW